MTASQTDNNPDDSRDQSRAQQLIYEVIFGYETRAGRLFDLVLIILILVSVAAVMLDSMPRYHLAYGTELLRLEWIFTLLFSIEYGLRLYSAPKKTAYVFSFYGLIDLFSILPTYIALLFPAAQYLIVIRIMRVLRIFRILKLFRYMGEASMLYTALKQARRKIFVFLFSVLTVITIFGALMFIIEGPENGFTSIPASIYWAIVTVTTVGYGDISPQTPLGQMTAAVAMISGYAIIAVPTGIIGAELINEYQERARRSVTPTRKCESCDTTDHEMDANFCKHCGERVRAI